MSKEETKAEDVEGNEENSVRKFFFFFAVKKYKRNES